MNLLLKKSGFLLLSKEWNQMEKMQKKEGQVFKLLGHVLEYEFDLTKTETLPVLFTYWQFRLNKRYFIMFRLSLQIHTQNRMGRVIFGPIWMCNSTTTASWIQMWMFLHIFMDMQWICPEMWQWTNVPGSKYI